MGLIGESPQPLVSARFPLRTSPLRGTSLRIALSSDCNDLGFPEFTRFFNSDYPEKLLHSRGLCVCPVVPVHASLTAACSTIELSRNAMAINIAILCRNVNAFRQLATRSRTTEQSLEASRSDISQAISSGLWFLVAMMTSPDSSPIFLRILSTPDRKRPVVYDPSGISTKREWITRISLPRVSDRGGAAPGCRWASVKKQLR